MKRWLACLVLLAGCTMPSEPPCIDANFCPVQLPPAALDEPRALVELVIDARTRRFPECAMCEEGSACASCERFYGFALRQLATLKTPEAAEQAVTLVVHPRLDWDAGAGLTLNHAIVTMGDVVLPYLRPHAATSDRAARLIECIEGRAVCY